MATDKESIEIVSEEVVKPKAKPRAKAKPKAKAAPKEDIPENETLLDVMLKKQHGIARLENGIYVRIYMEDFE